jgi:hypothetical protein
MALRCRDDRNSLDDLTDLCQVRGCNEIGLVEEYDVRACYLPGKTSRSNPCAGAVGEKIRCSPLTFIASLSIYYRLNLLDFLLINASRARTQSPGQGRNAHLFYVSRIHDANDRIQAQPPTELFVRPETFRYLGCTRTHPTLSACIISCSLCSDNGKRY